MHIILPNDHNPDKIINNEASNNSTEIVFSVFITCCVFNLEFCGAKFNVIYFFNWKYVRGVFQMSHHIVCKLFRLQMI